MDGEIDGRAHEVAAEWDRFGTGRGYISVDGVLADRWNIGMKWPGAQRWFAVAGRQFAIVRRGIAARQLELHASEPGLGWPVARPTRIGAAVAAVVVVVIAALAIAGVAIAVH